MSGKLEITFTTMPKDGTPFNIVLPFKVGKIYKKDDIVVNPTYQEDYTIMYMTTSMNTKIKSEISFQIDSSPTNLPQVNSDLNQEPNFLVIEQKGNQYYTFHLRFDVQLSHRPFKSLTSYLNSMIKPSHIYVTFPENANYVPLPTDMTCDISTGFPNTSNKMGNRFMTTSAFYQDRHLCINYIPPPLSSKSPLSPYNAQLTTIAFTLCSVVIVILSMPLEIVGSNVSKDDRILFASILLLVIPLLIFIDIFRAGLPFYLTSLSPQFNSNVQGIVFYPTFRRRSRRKWEFLLGWGK